MPLKKKTPALGDRLASASAKAQSAISTFTIVADELEAARAEALAVVDSAEREIAILQQIRDLAVSDAFDAGAAAANIRALVG